MIKYETISLSKPIDRTASLIVQKGEHYNYRKPSGCLISKNPIPFIPFKGDRVHDFTDKKIGRLTVLGRVGRTSVNPKGKWVCRCSCGNWTIKQAKSLKKYTRIPKCEECMLLEYQKKYYTENTLLT